MNKLTNADGEVAVLYSPGFGAGWFSWNSEAPQMLHDPEVVQWVLDGKPDDSKPNVEDGRYGEHFYSGGMYKLAVQWVKPGTRFRIDEYDGSETVVIDGDDQWQVA